MPANLIWNKIVAFVKANQWVQFILVFIGGVTIGALFYPTKHIVDTTRQEDQVKIDQLMQEKEQIQTTLTQQIQTLTQEKNDLELSTTKQFAELQMQIKDLESKKITSYYKIVHPDGTIEERQYTESDSSSSSKVISDVQEEYDKKISDINQQWQSKLDTTTQTQQAQFDIINKANEIKISELEKSKEVTINKKIMGIEVGYMSSQQYYSHINADIFGPLFVGAQFNTNFTTSTAVGAGLGIRF